MEVVTYSLPPLFLFLLYRENSLHRITKIGISGGITQFGDHSAFESRYFPEENYLIRHAEAGILSMTANGVDRVGSVFHITTQSALHLGLAFISTFLIYFYVDADIYTSYQMVD
jgi:cyclophilin family peptidyl-prolyl cis-trans isomerase